MSENPAVAKYSASASVATVRPAPPAPRCNSATSAHLCVLPWGQSATPAARARAAMSSTLRRSRARSMTSAGVGTLSKRSGSRIGRASEALGLDVVAPADGLQDRPVLQGGGHQLAGLGQPLDSDQGRLGGRVTHQAD